MFRSGDTAAGHTHDGGRPMLMTSAEYRESLRSHTPRVFIDGERVGSIADDPRLAHHARDTFATDAHADLA
jgi:aromatic ring hydroxylase